MKPDSVDIQNLGVSRRPIWYNPPQLWSVKFVKKRGHLALSCFNRHNEQRFPSKHDKVKPRYHSNKGSKASSPVANAIWYLDSGSSDHVRVTLAQFRSPMAIIPPKFWVTNGDYFLIHHIGSSTFLLAKKLVRINDILLAPSIEKNLLQYRNVLMSILFTWRIFKPRMMKSFWVALKAICIKWTRARSLPWQKLIPANQLTFKPISVWSHLWTHNSKVDFWLCFVCYK